MNQQSDISFKSEIQVFKLNQNFKKSLSIYSFTIQICNEINYSKIS